MLALTAAVKNGKHWCKQEQSLKEHTHTHTHTEYFVNSQLQNKHHLSSALKNIFENHNVGMLESLEDLHLPLHTAPVQAQATACRLTNLQELGCPNCPSGPLTHLSNLTKMPPERSKNVILSEHQAFNIAQMYYFGDWQNVFIFFTWVLRVARLVPCVCVSCLRPALPSWAQVWAITWAGKRRQYQGVALSLSLSDYRCVAGGGRLRWPHSLLLFSTLLLIWVWV